tara:strand:- start:14748 stop:16595 length:1848 start_codon:yes stop_codon:yes gene_type:complete
MIRQIFREASQPQPIEKIDKNGTVKWGVDNLYSQFLVGLMYDNPIHGGILNQKIKFITSGGIEATNPLALSNGKSPYNYQEIVDSVCIDNEVFNGWAVIYTRDLITNHWYAKPVDFELLRQTKTGVYIEYSDDWSKSTQSEKTNFKRYKSIFHATNEDFECIFYSIERPKQRKLEKSKDLTANYYPFPTYNGAITQIMAGIEMDYFTYSEVINGYKGGTVITLLNGVPDSIQEENKIIERVKGEATDRDKQGGLTVLFADGKDRAPEINQMNGNDLDKRYIETGKETVKKIMIAHSVISPALFGVLSETMFGSKEEMTVAYKLFQENYVKNRQDNIAEGLNWAYQKLNKEVLGLSFKEYTLQLEQNVSEKNAVSQSLNQMSPLVANKVLTSLTVNEIRSLASLPPIEGGDAIPTSTPAAFSSEINVIELFANCGVPRSGKQIVKSIDFNIDTKEDEFKASFFEGRFEMNLTDDDRNILQMIKAGESYDAISKAIGKGGVFISKRLFQLQANGYVNDWNVTDKGVAASSVLADFEVLYSYEKRPDAPDLVPGGESREFCATMMQMDKLYTREEIDLISSKMDRDVWTFRGGWYHNPDNDRNTPSCRHLWKMNLTVR